jgi:citrate lyase subunit gamma (acyl carrier protein)
LDIKNTAVAGTLESSDIMVTVVPGVKGVEIDLKSSVEKQFGAEIRRVITATLSDLGVKAAKVIAVDKGALDCVVRARVKTAVYRASGSHDYVWA